MTKTLFRMRSMDALIGKEREELHSQTIYFAKPDELNDPLDGFRSYFWDGDEIVWRNLFRNYLFCLHRTICIVKVIGDNTTIEPKMIPIYEYADHESKRDEWEMLERICTDVFRKATLDSLISSLNNTDRKIYLPELLFYLRAIHYIALPSIQNIHVDSGLSPERERMTIPPRLPSKFLSLPNLIEQVWQAKKVSGFNGLGGVLHATAETQSYEHDISQILFGTMNRILDSHKFMLSLTTEGSSNILPSNRQLIIWDFPNVYLEELKKLAFPAHSVACFMNDYGNSSLWGHYADKHKGACLMFRGECRSGRAGITLTQATAFSSRRRPEDGGIESKETWNPRWMPFYEMSYRESIPSIDFFGSIGVLPKPMLLHNWYTDHKETRSNRSGHLESSTEEKWRASYWDEFVRGATVKTKDWEYESEYRLILHSHIFDLEEKEKRTLTYEFSALTGIIFGIKTSEQDKRRVIEIVNGKRENRNSDFKFYQAYFDHGNNRIEKQEIEVPITVGSGQ